MTIENRDAYMNNIWDWKILDGCFGSTSIKPMDIDGHVERKGKHLFIETKSPNVPVKTGQWLSFKSLVENHGFMGIIVWGSKDVPEEMQVLYPNKPVEESQKRKADIIDLRRVVSWWFDKVDN